MVDSGRLENTFLQPPKSGSSCRMTPESPPARRPRRMPRVPAFYPVPIRSRRDGWTPQRQADFLGYLAETGSVMGACEAVGMSRKSAYRLPVRPGAESFAAAWDAALGAPEACCDDPAAAAPEPGYVEQPPIVNAPRTDTRT